MDDYYMFIERSKYIASSYKHVSTYKCIRC